MQSSHVKLIMLQAVSIFCLLPGGDREQEFNRICSDQKENPYPSQSECVPAGYVGNLSDFLTTQLACSVSVKPQRENILTTGW